MEYYPTLVTLHIIFAGGWLISFITDSILKKSISNKKNISESKMLINLYLKVTNQLGMMGASGILFTGILMVILNPGYGFFSMSANHWLATKQTLMVVLLLIIFVFIIPTARKIRNELQNNMVTDQSFSEDIDKHLTKIYKLNTIVNLIVLLNFLFAITHRFIG